MRHDEIRDTFAAIMKDVCFDVEIEPKLQPLEGDSFVHTTTTTEDDTRLDFKANGLWDLRFCRTFFDVKIFNPLAKSCPKDINEAYKFHETQKKLKYESRIIKVEKRTFNPLVFACTGGAGPSASKVITRLASKVNEKSTESYSEAIRYIRTKKFHPTPQVGPHVVNQPWNLRLALLSTGEGCHELDNPSGATNPRINAFFLWTFNKIEIR